MKESTTPVKTVLIDAETTHLIDTTSLEILEKLQSELAKKDILSYLGQD